jgi:hypothetical protein
MRVRARRARLLAGRAHHHLPDRGVLERRRQPAAASLVLLLLLLLGRLALLVLLLGLAAALAEVPRQLLPQLPLGPCLQLVRCAGPLAERVRLVRLLGRQRRWLLVGPWRMRRQRARPLHGCRRRRCAARLADTTCLSFARACIVVVAQLCAPAAAGAPGAPTLAASCGVVFALVTSHSAPIIRTVMVLWVVPATVAGRAMAAVLLLAVARVAASGALVVSVIAQLPSVCCLRVLLLLPLLPLIPSVSRGKEGRLVGPCRRPWRCAVAAVLLMVWVVP